MTEYKGLPVIEMTIDGDGLAVDAVALVDKPAIQRTFQMFNDEQHKVMFAIQDEDRHIISGALMLSDTPIFRTDPKRGDFYCVFSKETIEKIAVKFFENGYQSNVNLQHNNGEMLQGLTMFESFISDKSRGILPMKGFEDCPDGSWFGSFKIKNEDAWQLIKEGKVKGFSVEGLFSLAALEKDEFLEELEKILSE